MRYKEFELIGSSFKCDKNCPYCTAKITRWPVVEDKFRKVVEATRKVNSFEEKRFQSSFVTSDEKFFDRFEWRYKGVPITFYAKKLDYGYSNIVYYGGELVDYHLNKIM